MGDRRSVMALCSPLHRVYHLSQRMSSSFSSWEASPSYHSALLSDARGHKHVSLVFSDLPASTLSCLTNSVKKHSHTSGFLWRLGNFSVFGAHMLWSSLSAFLQFVFFQFFQPVSQNIVIENLLYMRDYMGLSFHMSSSHTTRLNCPS